MKGRDLYWYIVFNNGYSGIIQSQVIDRLRFIVSAVGVRIRLVVFVPWGMLRKQKELYREYFPNTLVLPILFGLSRWRVQTFTLIFLALIHRPKRVIGRAIFAANLGLDLRRLGLTDEVFYDGRGAVLAEWQEFLGTGGWPIIESRIRAMEHRSVHLTDRQLAVSHALQKYWTDRYSFNADSGAFVIPCLLGEHFVDYLPDQATRNELRRSLSFNEEHIILVLSASKSDWQSIEHIVSTLEKWMRMEPRMMLLLLTNQDVLSRFSADLQERIVKKWVDPMKVPAFFSIGDYGVLLRPQALTNQVASPVKFAEYLASGLRILISPNVGDYSVLVQENDLGILIEDDNGVDVLEWRRTTENERQRLRALAIDYLSLKGQNDELIQAFT